MFRKIHDAWIHSSKRILFLDYDGTLVPFTRIPSEARLKPESREIILSLTENVKNKVIVISGRDRIFLEQQFKDIPVDLIAEHGFLFRNDGNNWKFTKQADLEWKNQVRDLILQITAIIPGTFLEEKEASIVLHYRSSDIQPCDVPMVKDLLNIFRDDHKNLDYIFGNHVIEIKASGFSKGTTASYFLENLDHDFLLAMGDDVTDETLFRELKGRAFTIKIGFGKTDAGFRLPFQKDVLPFLKELSITE